MWGETKKKIFLVLAAIQSPLIRLESHINTVFMGFVEYFSHKQCLCGTDSKMAPSSLPPSCVHVLCHPLPWGVGGTCDLLPTDGMWY